MVEISEYKLCPVILTYKSEGDIQGVLNDISKGLFSIKYGVPEKNGFIYYIDQRKDFSVIYVRTKKENKLAVLIMINVTDVRNQHYFKGWFKEGHIPVPCIDIGGFSNINDIIGKNVLGAWEEIEKKYKKSCKKQKKKSEMCNEILKGEALGFKRRVEIVFERYKSDKDIKKIIEQVVHPPKRKKLRIIELQAKPKRIMSLPYKEDSKKRIPLSIIIMDYGAQNTSQVYIIMESDGLKEGKIFEKKKEISVPMIDVGWISTRKDLVKGIEKAEELIYKGTKI